MGNRFGICRKGFRIGDCGLYGEDQLRTETLPTFADADMGCAGNCIAQHVHQIGKKSIDRTPHLSGEPGNSHFRGDRAGDADAQLQIRARQRIEPRFIAPDDYWLGSRKTNGDGR
ncbi:hypothetical protein SDC9_199269 [bioreactor metagenome]|uniref:Uncharacterized protein n=1 Tax=bioreactor metagenome TaxID=1076179 RepID=A0A645IK03_9ZZZZ